VIRQAAKRARKRHAAAGKTLLQIWQQRALVFYESDPVQMGVAVLIVLNFAANVAQAEMLPAGTYIVYWNQICCVIVSRVPAGICVIINK